MGVKNAQKYLKKTIDSILSQNGVEIEFIIINDGSTDGTETILREEASRDERIRLVSRENRGLTASLIEGCGLVRGEFIARQDANDISLPGRLLSQVSALKATKDASFCSTYVRHVTKEGLEALITSVEGVIHGSVMMPRDAYLSVGGYRKEFYYAQDIDLWSRLKQQGQHIVIPKVFYEGLLFANSISATMKKEQEKYLHIINKATEARLNNKSETDWLLKADKLAIECQRLKNSNHGRSSDGSYFIGACLIPHNPILAEKYLTEALRNNPMHLRARYKLARLRCFYQ